MIILDTNILSELMRPTPAPAVVQWLDQQPTHQIWLTSITITEAEFGLHTLPDGKRKQRLWALFKEMLAEDFQGRVLAFDHAAAQQTALLLAKRKTAGRPIDHRDTQIAGITLAQEAMLATRNVKHFSDIGHMVANPWD